MTPEEMICYLRNRLNEQSEELEKLRYALYMVLSGKSTCVGVDHYGKKEKDCESYNSSSCVDCRYNYILSIASQEISVLNAVHGDDKKLV